MTELKQVYRCNVCRNIVEIVHAGKGQLICCGQPMELLKEKIKDVGKEKHAPVIKKTRKEIKVKVGSKPHPMEKMHYIEWIELIADGRIYRKYLKPGDRPEAVFELKAKKIKAREYCNVHGLWKA